MRFLEEAEVVLGSAEGERAWAYLHGRGLNDETLRAWRSGFQPEEERRDPAERGAFLLRLMVGQAGCVSRAGPSFRWFLDGRLWQLKVRTNRQKPKYLAVASGYRACSGPTPW
jgi:hypothetical protein